jgi:hypothetical protein
MCFVEWPGTHGLGLKLVHEVLSVPRPARDAHFVCDPVWMWHPGAWPCQQWRLDGGGDLAHTYATAQTSSSWHDPSGLGRLWRIAYAPDGNGEVISGVVVPPRARCGRRGLFARSTLLPAICAMDQVDDLRLDDPEVGDG